MRPPAARWAALRLLPLLAALLLSAPSSPAAQEAETGLLEIGLGGAWASLPHYRGSDQRRNYAAPFPYIRYEGKRLKLNREGGQFYFLYTPRLRIDLSASLAPPVYSEDNHAREGMPDLNPVFEIGPRTELFLYRSEGGHLRVSASFPLRMGIATDLRDTRTAGWTFSPYLLFRFDHEWDADLSIGPLWADETNHDYLYEVEPRYATAERPAYDAKGGYSGARITFSLGERFDSWWFGLFVRYDTLEGAAFEESPLVRRREAIMYGAALTTILYEER